MNTKPEEQKAILDLSIKTAFKSVLNNIPIVGVILSDVLFEYRNKVKQDRINHFIDLLRNYFETIDSRINIDNIKSDEFGDLFENVLRKVSLSRSLKKQIAFKNILLKAVESNNVIDYCEIFMELLSRMHEKQIDILSLHYYTFNNKSCTLSIWRELNLKIYNVQTKIDKNKDQPICEKLRKTEIKLKTKSQKIRNALDKNKKVRTAKHYDISEAEYNFYIQDLYNMGLLFDEGIGSIGTGPFEVMRVTELGVNFLVYINNP